ncbi:MAG: TonB-dependent receptor [Steroidobacteraceae bacterium]
MSKIRTVVSRTITFAALATALAAGPARAQSAGGASAAAPASVGLDEVVVTATKRNEDVQNVGVSMTVLGSAQLESKGVEQFMDYGTSIPNLSFGIGAADGSLAGRGIALRGIQGANTTGFYIDDVPVLETLDPHIVDIARIEVLRGPQGTLYGAESMGGTVRIITEQPNATATTGQLHVAGSGTEHGSLNELVEGVANMPLVADTVAVRASAFYQNDEGFFDKELGPESAPPTSSIDHVGGTKYWGGQIALLFQPVSGLSITPRVMYQQTEQDGAPYAALHADNLVQREVFNIHEGGTDKWWLASLTLNYTVPFGTFVSSSALFDRKTFETEDDTDVLQLDLGLAGPLPSPITRKLALRRFAQEVRFASSLSGPFQYILGGFYSDSTRPRDYEWTGQGMGAVVGYPNDLALAFVDSRGAKEYALFGDASYDIVQNLKATVGLRWFRDTATFTQFTDGLFFGGVPTTYNASPTSESGFTPKYMLEYKVTPDVLTYVSAAKGFREGGNNIALPPGPPPGGCDQDLKNAGLTAAGVAAFKSDKLWDYEVGAKSNFFDRRVTLDAAAFLIDWDQIQQLVSLPLCGYGLTGNSGKARSTGFEFQSNARLLPQLTWGLGFGYDNAHITEQGPGTPQTVGSPIYQVPRITISTNLEYEQHLTAQWLGFARFDWSHIGESFSANNTQVNPLRRGAYNLANIRFGARNDRWEVAAFIKNLTDIRANLGDAILIGAQIPGEPRFVISRPLTAGLEARLRFE